ncbi:PqqD family peptide modification chaperone [Streptomyces sp. NPDC057579]|uniref:PqqD family peptide modification chaperone n=1 Tax=Streptomyces sp. NPDC057579 TaxID=3346172 RepID=UPI003676BF2B
MRLTAAATTGTKAAAGATSTRHDAEAPEGTAWLDTAPLSLKTSIEQMDGINGRPLLFDTETGQYVALSRAGLVVLALLDDAPTAREVVRRVTASSAADPQHIETIVLRFLGELRQAGVLTLPPQEQNRRQRLMKRSLRQRMPRLVLTRSVHVLLEPVARLLRKLPTALIVTCWLLLVTVGATAVCVALVERGLPHLSSWAWLAMLLLAAQIAVHELGHALVCQYLRVPVREAGITLLLYVMPVAYVDRTDAYRVRNRAPRILIAMAGPLSDAIWAGVTAVVLLSAHGAVADVAGALLYSQLFLMMINLNPLLPSDGYQALESAVGSVNLRGRSFAYLTHVVTRAPLPSHLLVASRAKRVGYLVFGGLCLAYGVFVVGAVLLSWWHIFEAVRG